MKMPATPQVVAHLDLDTFFVSVERLKDSRLEGLPVIVGGSGDRAVVSSCSYEARRFGVHSAMPMRLARRLCPAGVFVSGDFDAYQQYSNLVTEVIDDSAPLYEKASIDEFYLDMTGMERFYGCWKWAGELRQRIIRETGLPLSFGLSVNKLVSKVATGSAKPNGQKEVKASEVEHFLAPMPLRRIPMIGEKTATALAQMGIRDVATLRKIPREVLEHVYGRHGILLWERARGIDDSLVVPHGERKSVSTESTFQEDSIDISFLRAQLVRMTEELAFKLRSERKLCACVAVKLRYSNFETVTRQARIPYTANDEALIQHVLQLFDKLYQKRVLIRLVGVRLSQLVYGGHQVRLFEDTEKKVDLYEAVDAIKHKYGGKAVRLGRGL